MNGLRYIRTQCNFSLSELADRLDVSRQIISAWENGKKEIPEARKVQMAEFFGIDKSFFDDIILLIIVNVSVPPFPLPSFLYPKCI